MRTALLSRKSIIQVDSGEWRQADHSHHESQASKGPSFNQVKSNLSLGFEGWLLPLSHPLLMALMLGEKENQWKNFEIEEVRKEYQEGA